MGEDMGVGEGESVGSESESEKYGCIGDGELLENSESCDHSRITDGVMRIP